MADLQLIAWVFRGNIDNVDIGYNPTVQIRTYGIDMTNAPDSTASTINLNGAQVNGDSNMADNVVLTRIQ